MKFKAIHFFLCFVFIFLPSKSFAVEGSKDLYEDKDDPLSFMVEVLPWDQVNNIMPKYTIFTIIDVETGLSFKVQRRAGSQHADVQPLTYKDTKIMKKVYNGKWSWNRRAILVLVGDQLLAASMHGMPHGAGALNNGFPGHFCVHFWESTTHKKEKMDPSHQLMILKAAGKLEDYLNGINPYKMIEIFALAVNNHDKNILGETLAQNKYKQKLTTKMIKDISYFSIIEMPLVPMEDLHGQFVMEVPVKVEFLDKNKGKSKKFIHFVVRRDSLIDRWYIEGQTVLKEVNIG